MELPEISEIERARKRRGLTQTQLAEKAGVSQSLIARAEAGSVDPRYSKVKRIFAALSEGGAEVTAESIMTRKVVSVSSDDTVEKAARIMEKHGLSQVPVYDGKTVVGSISDQLIRDEIGRGVSGEKISKKKVGDCMGDAFPQVTPKTPLSTISKILENDTAVMVVDKGSTKGIITNSDLLKVLHG